MSHVMQMTPCPAGVKEILQKQRGIAGAAEGRAGRLPLRPSPGSAVSEKVPDTFSSQPEKAPDTFSSASRLGKST